MSLIYYVAGSLKVVVTASTCQIRVCVRSVDSADLVHLGLVKMLVAEFICDLQDSLKQCWLAEILSAIVCTWVDWFTVLFRNVHSALQCNWPCFRTNFSGRFCDFMASEAHSVAHQLAPSNYRQPLWCCANGMYGKWCRKFSFVMASGEIHA